jgi:hypothetical protein
MMSNNIFEEWSGHLFYARTGRGTGRGWCERGRRKMSSRLIKRSLLSCGGRDNREPIT